MSMIDARRAALGLSLAVMIAACGSSAPAASTPLDPSAPGGSPSLATAAPSLPTAAPTPSASSERPSPTPSPSTALARTGRIDVASAGYALTLPANWFRIDLSKDDLDAFAKSGSSAISEQAGAALTKQIAQLAANRISLFALRFADKKALLGTNINVLTLPSGGFDLDTLEQLNLGQYASIFGKDVVITHQRVALPAGDAVRFSYTIKSSAASGSQTLGYIQHLVISGDLQLILTCTAPGGITKIVDECDGIAESIAFD
jgi:hypothetical protein